MNPTLEDIQALSIDELKAGIKEFEQALDDWPEDESGADHVLMFRNFYQRALDEKEGGEQP